jgi:hypothetical protein
VVDLVSGSSTQVLPLNAGTGRFVVSHVRDTATTFGLLEPKIDAIAANGWLDETIITQNERSSGPVTAAKWRPPHSTAPPHKRPPPAGPSVRTLGVSSERCAGSGAGDLAGTYR